MLLNVEKEQEYLPWSLYVDGTKDSNDAADHLLGEKVPYTEIQTPRLPNGKPEEECPCLLTGVGLFIGLKRIKYVTKSFYETILEYQGSRKMDQE